MDEAEVFLGRIRGLWASDGKFWRDVSCLVE